MFKKGWKYQEEDKTGGGTGSAADGTTDTGTTKTDGTATDTTDTTGTKVEAKWQDNWRETYAGDDEKKLNRLGRYATPAAAFDALLGLQNKISAGELRSVLPKDATPEQINAWRTENGVPDDPAKYEVLGAKDKIPEADRERMSAALKELHGLNVNNAQAAKVVDMYYGVMEQMTQDRADQDKVFAQQAEDKLRAEWGNDYRANINMINGLVATAPASVQDLFKTGRLGNGDPLMAHPEVMMWMNSLARQINPVTTLIPNAGGDIAGSIDDEIKKIETTMRTDRKAYNNDAKMQERYRQLLEAREKSKKAA